MLTTFSGAQPILGQDKETSWFIFFYKISLKKKEERNMNTTRYKPLGPVVIDKDGQLNPREVRRRINTNTVLAILGIILGFATAGAFIGTSIYFGTRINELGGQISTANMNNLLLTQQLGELAMNTSALINVTIIETGTFNWRFGYDGGNYVNVPGTYALKSGLIGPFSFIILRVSPPATPYTFPAGATVAYEFALSDWSPGTLNPVGIFEGLSFPLTFANAQRMQMSCLQDTTCFENAFIDDGYFITHNTLKVDNSGALTPQTNQLKGVFTPVAAVAGKSFTLNGDWELFVTGL
jgi:hypothetical protein